MSLKDAEKGWEGSKDADRGQMRPREVERDVDRSLEKIREAKKRSREAGKSRARPSRDYREAESNHQWRWNC